MNYEEYMDTIIKESGGVADPFISIKYYENGSICSRHFRYDGCVTYGEEGCLYLSFLNQLLDYRGSKSDINRLYDYIVRQINSGTAKTIVIDLSLYDTVTKMSYSNDKRR